MKKFLLLDAAFEGVRMLPGAVSVSYLVTKGISLGDIAVLKMVQATFGFLLELPTGLVADQVGRRFSLLMATLCGMFCFFLYVVADSFLIFLIAEFFLALCLCLWSGAFEAYAIDSAKESMSETEVHRFFHTNSGVNSAGTIVGGVAGAAISSFAGFLPFAFCALGMLVIFGGLIFFYPNDNRLLTIKATTLKEALIQTVHINELRMLFSSENMRLYLPLAAGQFVIQPVIYYWQPWFLPWSQGKEQWKLGVIFMAIQGALLIAGMVGRKLNQMNLKPSLIQNGAWVLFGSSILAMSFTDTLLGGVFLLLLAEIGLGLGLATAKGNLCSVMNSSNRASVLSSAALIGRIAGLASLLLMAGVSKVFPDNHTSLQIIYFSAGTITLCFLALGPLRYLVRSRDNSKRIDYVKAAGNQ